MNIVVSEELYFKRLKLLGLWFLKIVKSKERERGRKWLIIFIVLVFEIEK